MNTLHEFMLQTKAQEYLLAILFLILFPLFWRWLNGTGIARSNRK